MESFDIGDVVQIRSYSAAGEGFKVEDGTLTDPTTVTITVERPDGDETSYSYPGVSITRESAGRFSVNFSPTTGGVHHWRIAGPGAVAAAVEGAFFVRSSRF